MASNNKHAGLAISGNIVYGVVLLALAVLIGYLQIQATQLNRADTVAAASLSKWQNKLDKLQQRNDRIVYLPKAGDVNLSNTQVKTVQELSSLFTQLTTFNNSTTYATNYKYAKSIVNDSSFFDDFLLNPVDDSGHSIVSASNLKMKNVRTQVVVTGDNTYRVAVTYIPYHAASDLYQESSLTTLTQIFNVTGSVGDYSKMSIDTTMQPNSMVVKAGDIE